MQSGQNRVFCADCDAWVYNAPRTETGERPRSVQTIHNGIRPKQRARVLLRANGRCELCNAGTNLHVGHLLSVADGFAAGLTEIELNHDENLCALCEECNLGLGHETIPLRFAIRLLRQRIQKEQSAG